MSFPTTGTSSDRPGFPGQCADRSLPHPNGWTDHQLLHVPSLKANGNRIKPTSPQHFGKAWTSMRIPPIFAGRSRMNLPGRAGRRRWPIAPNVSQGAGSISCRGRTVRMQTENRRTDRALCSPARGSYSRPTAVFRDFNDLIRICPGRNRHEPRGQTVKARRKSGSSRQSRLQRRFPAGALLDMYDPDRSQTVSRAGIISDWDTFIGALRPRLAQKAANGSGFAILTETITSPTLLKQIRNLKAKYPGALWFVHDPLSRRNIREGLRIATGGEIMPHYDFTKADVIVSLDCDFLAEEPGHSRYARDFQDGRRIREETPHMNRLYVIESTHSITGTIADHRWAVRPSEIAGIADEIAKAIRNSPTAQGWTKAIADDLRANRGKCLVLAGATSPLPFTSWSIQSMRNWGILATRLFMPARLKEIPTESCRILYPEWNPAM